MHESFIWGFEFEAFTHKFDIFIIIPDLKEIATSIDTGSYTNYEGSPSYCYLRSLWFLGSEPHTRLSSFVPECSEGFFSFSVLSEFSGYSFGSS